ncbi:MAG: class I SAM-dependent methyltransferase [Rhodospirillaceae bacterium]|nr:class I SAM-dependent methyltransferase [Rhodospirillaceae bacterium]
MNKNFRLSDIYEPSHDERARQAFVGTLKAHVNGPLEVELAQLYESKIKPAFEAKTGHAPRSRDEATPAFNAEPMYQTWGAMVYTSQDFMWETVGDTVDRLRPAFEARAKEIAAGKRLGTLTLNPALEIPEPIASTEIHRQPGNYFFQNTPDDLTAAMLYMGTVELYRAAKGLGGAAKTGEPMTGPFIAKVVTDKFPDIKPKRILDIGCATGIETVAYKRRWPEAEVHGLDLSGPLVRFAHVWAEDKGVDMHFHQMNAAHTSFPDGHFDLIVSHILFHETWHDVQDAIMREVKRILAPGGHFVNADVPYQPAVLPMTKQVTNAWQVKHNGEPYWTGFADRDVRQSLIGAGFAPDSVFADYVPIGQGQYYFFGATQKT